jgi:hypothetical protein
MADEFDDEEMDLVEADDDLDLDDADDDLADDDLAVVEVEEVADDVVLELEGDTVPVAKSAPTGGDDSDDEDDENLDLEEELHPDDVEEPLDVLLAERTAAERMDEDEAELEDDDLEPDDRAEGGGKIVPRRDDEFLCRSCFLVKPLSQLAKGEKDLCRDCE